ncbi:MAG: methyltransferase domain-containing protein [Abitibacteriaceae bacterium]|nr:methyltransferase domain-containing protein [Abditibacteriaceae bacterium]MBV9865350.1 methyltransferase domain-containing protein [Abditibacteriaceae bacterium]
MKLNLGCGNKRMPGFIGVDLYPCEAADILCDITGRLPFRDSSIDEIYLDNVIEHIRDIPALMKEVVRVSKNGAQMTIITPHLTSLSSWRDPTHVHHLSYFSFDHFEKASVTHYVGGGLKVVGRKLSFGGGVLGLTGRLIFTLSPKKYEEKYCFIFRASTLTFYLKVTK